MLKATTLSLFALPFALMIQTAKAEQAAQHLYEATKTDPVLAVEFNRVMEPFFSNSPWTKSFGTTAAAAPETVDGQSYDVYWGCKPHDCVTESYVLMYHRASKKITAGAFLINDYNGPNLSKSRITWLEKTEFESARVLGKYLY